LKIFLIYFLLGFGSVSWLLKQTLMLNKSYLSGLKLWFVQSVLNKFPSPQKVTYVDPHVKVTS
jgi:hypothetical protein